MLFKLLENKNVSNQEIIDDVMLLNEAPYLDPEEKFYDYKTGDVSGTDVIDTSRTGMSYYDDFLKPSESEYLAKEHNLKGEIVYMTPQEYFEECAAHGFPNSPLSVDRLKYERGELDKKTIEHLKEVILKYKKKFPLPFINYAEKGQEGLHRFYTIGELFGWTEHKYPVLKITHASEEEALRREQAKRASKIQQSIRYAIKDTLRYHFTDIDELKEQLQWSLDREFQFDDSIEKPVKFTLKEDNDYMIVEVAGVTEDFEKASITFVEKEATEDSTNTDDDIDIDDIDLDEFMERYFGKNWQTDHKDTYDKLRKANESLEVDRVDKDTIRNVLDDHNHCYYQNTSMVLELICEKLYYEHGIDARYSGRSIYVKDKKIATIHVEKDGPDLLGMYGYTLFI